MAIVRGTAANADSGATSPTSLSFSVTIPATNPYVVVGVCVNSNPVRTTTGVTCGGSAMTKIGTEHTNITNSDGRTQAISLWELVAPASGSKTVVVTLSGTAYTVGAIAQPYSGVVQSSVRDGSVAEGENATLATITDSVTLGVSGSWAIFLAGALNSGVSSLTNTTLCGTSFGTCSLFDTQALISPIFFGPAYGSLSMSATNVSGANAASWIMAGVKNLTPNTMDSGSSSDSISTGFSTSISDTSSGGTDTATLKYGWNNQQKSSTTWVNQNKS